jgi:hypothetical protein
VPAASFHYFNWLVPSIPTQECLNINVVPQSTANKGLAEEVRRRNEWMENTHGRENLFHPINPLLISILAPL